MTFVIGASNITLECETRRDGNKSTLNNVRKLYNTIVRNFDTNDAGVTEELCHCSARLIND